MKKFTKHAQNVFNHNPNVEKCTESKIFFKEEFALKVCEIIKVGGDIEAFFYENGISVRVLGESRFSGLISLWKSKYFIEDAPRRQKAKKAAPKVVETPAQKKQKALDEAVLKVSAAVASDTEDAPVDQKTFKAIKEVYENSENVILKDLCKRFGYDYSYYYAYLKKSKPKQEHFNLLNSHRKNK